MSAAAKPLDTSLKSTNLVRKALYNGLTYLALGGGTSAAKTYGTLIALLVYAVTTEPPTENPVISVVGQTVPKIKSGLLRDWETIRSHEPTCRRLSKTDRTYTVNGWTVELIALDNPEKARGPRRHIMMVDEANLSDWEVIDDMIDRTAELTIFTYNPTSRFAVHDLVEANPAISGHFRLTYKDNPYVPAKTRRRIESWEVTNPRKWRVMGLGLLGKVEGLVYPDYNLAPWLDTDTPKRFYWGADFGYTTDPTAIVESKLVGNKLYMREWYYTPTPRTSDCIDAVRASSYTARHTLACENDTVMVNALVDAGIEAVKVTKGPGSIEAGISLVSNYELCVDPNSSNLIYELQNYSRKEVAGRFTDPIDADNHLMDALRYSHMLQVQPDKPKKKPARIVGFRSLNF